MGMAAEDDVDAGDAAGELQIDVHAVMRQQHDRIDLVLLAQAVDHFLQFGIADAEGPVRREALGMRDRHIGHGLADDADAVAADFLDGRRLEHTAGSGVEAGASLNAASSVRKTFCARNSPLKLSRLLRSVFSP